MYFLPDVEFDWMKRIPSSVICQYFFILFALIAGVAGLVLLMDLYVIVVTKGKKGLGMLIRSVLAFSIPVVNALFLYLLCTRSLLEKK